MKEEQQKLNRLIQLSLGEYEAFLYDCDGTLADTMGAHKKTYVDVAANRYGVTFDSDLIDELAGWPVVDVVTEINKRYTTAMDPVEFAEIRQRLFFEKYIDETKPIEFVVQHLLQHSSIKRIGVVSGGRREAVEKTLRILGIQDHIAILVCADETPRGKPFPDPFLAAAEQLGVPPNRCLVFEDGDAGETAARNAGMGCIRIDRIH